jgi:hypothetical protein
MKTQQSDLNTDATNVRGSETPQTLPLGSQKTCFRTKQNQHQYLSVLSHFLVTVHCYQEHSKATSTRSHLAATFLHTHDKRGRRGALQNHDLHHLKYRIRFFCLHTRSREKACLVANAVAGGDKDTRPHASQNKLRVYHQWWAKGPTRFRRSRKCSRNGEPHFPAR